MESTMMGSMWYLDSSASVHMMGNKYFFSDLEEKDLQINIEFWEDKRYSAIEIGTVTIQRSQAPLSD